ncbi:carboxypeptidase-like regulatory domain-containing protein [Gemmatimonas groenlandica]|uniref:Carboxypeptidase regulatory-like domain-containing protein n=1 Tax=Gemmatimonas groenlandica TaxID=2732249 RepID=A0A6M4IL38_9BACT|nr:carboxypeptidase-like regulatory domain-containing protein [Gemmatimonas groenlandica]QJR35734.1 carboxypeptidase regulatory-like domain-containing protein [Gemmatimonas groenlandica]
MFRSLFVFILTAPALLAAQVRPATPAPQLIRARVVGTVFDSAATQWLGGATVQLVDASNPSNVRTAIAAANGRFAIDSVAVGTYLIGFFHQRLDQLGIEAPLFRVNITTPEELEVPMAIPSAESIITKRCGPGDPEQPMGLYMGFVRSAATNQQVPAARVRAQYTEVTVGSRGVERRYPSRFGSSTDDGLFTLCGVPRNAPVTARAYAGADSTGFIELRIPRNGLLVRDLVIGSTNKGTGALRGTVKSASGKEIASARVVLWGASGNGANTANGQYTLDGLPTGTQMVEARAIGYQPMRLAVDVPAGNAATADITLETLVATVDTVRVRGDRVSNQMVEFEKRRRAGFGAFIDENQLNSRAPIFMADIFRSVPGVVIASGQSPQGRVMMRNNGGTCAPAVFLNGMNVQVPDGNLDAIMNSQEVMAVEVYSRTASVPAQFDSRNGCGSIVVWTGPRKQRR